MVNWLNSNSERIQPHESNNQRLAECQVKFVTIKKNNCFVMTGNEAFNGPIKDSFDPILRKELEDFGSEVIHVCFAHDGKEAILFLRQQYA